MPLIMLQIPNPISQVDSSVLISPNGIAIAVLVILSVIILLVVGLFIRSYSRLSQSQANQISKLEITIDEREKRIGDLQQWKETALPVIAQFETLQSNFDSLSKRFSVIETERLKERFEYEVTLNAKDELIRKLTQERDFFRDNVNTLKERIAAVEGAANLYPIIRSERDTMENELSTLRPRLKILERLLTTIRSSRQDLPPELMSEIDSTLNNMSKLITGTYEVVPKSET